MLQRFKLDGKTMLKMAEIFQREMELGLADKPSSLLMENTYVPELPNGTGSFFILTFISYSFLKGQISYLRVLR